MRQQHPGDRYALLILDMISEFSFPDGEQVLRAARSAAPAIARLKQRAHRAGIPIVYANDTAGAWESDQRAFVERCAREDAPGRDVVNLVRPSDDDYFMFKPRHSAFFGTPLPQLLEKLRVGTLILTGVTTHQCVLFTGMDAHVREYRMIVPRDCVGAQSSAETRHALFIFERALNARVMRSTSLRLRRQRQRSARLEGP